MHPKSLQLCLTLCNTVGHSLQGSSVRGMLQARILDELPFPPLRDLPDPGIEPKSLLSPALAGGFFTTRATWEAHKSREGCPKKLDIQVLPPAHPLGLIHPKLCYPCAGNQLGSEPGMFDGGPADPEPPHNLQSLLVT